MHQLSDHPTEDEVMSLLRSVLKDNPELFTKREDDHGCFMRALRRGEPTFTLVAQDVTSLEIVATWLTENTQLSPERKNQVRERLKAMAAWPVKKRAD